MNKPDEQLALIDRAHAHTASIALRTRSQPYSYGDLLNHSSAIATALVGSSHDLNESRIAYLVPAGFDYVGVQWGIWRAGGIAVPLSLSASEPELEYTLTDSQADTVVTTSTGQATVEKLTKKLGIRLLVVDEVLAFEDANLPGVDSSRRAMILYTSGTTSKPKGVVSTHVNIEAQIKTLVDAWRWESTDCIPLFLPLHHVHGIINVMSCALWTGATVEPFAQFEMDAILARVSAQAYSVFMAVPTIYVKLIQTLESLPKDTRAEVVDGFAAMRLMVSGSAALPASVHQQWTELTGQELLERYGMTEIGMALSNPYDGERRPGAVGQPLPGVDIRLVSENGDVVTTENDPGEIQVRGNGVFREYWHRPEATTESFQHGWFKTGDIAVLEDGYYRIMGRQSVDIIKSGGYKLSALEIESVLLQHPLIQQCAVVGTADETWGEAVAAAVVVTEGETLTLDELRPWCGEKLSHYKIPKRLLVVDQLPRNAMGKVTKPAVSKLFV